MDSSRIGIKTSQGTEYMKIEKILVCVAKGRCTKLVTTEGKEFLLTRILKDIEGSLPESDFYRTHKSYLINLNHIIHYKVNREYPITLINDVKVNLSKRKKQEFQRMISERIQTL